MEDNKILFKMKCVERDIDHSEYYTVGKIYTVFENKGFMRDNGKWSSELLYDTSSFDKWNNWSTAKWELVEETLLDMIYEKLGIEDLEEFRIKKDISEDEFLYRFNEGELEYFSEKYKKWENSLPQFLRRILIGDFKIIKLPKQRSKKHQEELNKLLQPVFEYMQKELNPHCTLIVTPTEGELVEGVCGVKSETILD